MNKSMRLPTLVTVLLAVVSVVLVQADQHAVGLEEIRQWWQGMSAQKPLKQCQAFFRRQRELFEAKEKEYNKVEMQPIFYVDKCFPSETQKPFVYRGQVENHKFEGPGKFSVDTTLDSTADISNICYYNRTLFGVQIRSIVGTFVNGRPEGLAKVEGNDGSVVIAMFRSGAVHGFFRVWKPNKELRLLGFSYNNLIVGHCWRKFNDGDLMLYNCDDVNNEKVWREELDQAVLIHNDSQIFVGRVESFHQSLGSVRSAKLVSSEAPHSSCFLIPSVSKVGGDSRRYDLYRAKFVEYSKLNSSLCPQGTEDTKKFMWQWHERLSQLQINPLWEQDTLREPLAPTATALFRDIKWLEGRNFSCKLQNSDKSHNFTLIEGQVDGEKRIHGNVKMRFSRNSAALSRDPVLDQGYTEIHGYMSFNTMDGPGLLELEDGRKMRVLIKQNVLHGPTLIMGQRTIFPLDPIYKIDNRDPKHGDTKHIHVGSLILFRNGMVAKNEPMFLFPIGGGLLYFPKGETTDDEAAYVFPDYETAYYGRFENKVMKSGKVATLKRHQCLQHGLLRLEFELDPDHSSEPPVFYSPPTNTSLGPLSWIRDPFEQKQVHLLPSNIKGAGQGVFARRPIPMATLICPYVGFEYRNLEESELYHIRHVYNRSLSDEMRRWGKKYSINTAYTGAQLNIPPEWDNEKGVITMGQKVNCAFEEMRNCGFADIDHPRWGITIGVFATRDIEEGEELLTDYGYGDHPFPMDHPWYHEAKRQFKLDKQKRIELEEQKKSKKKQKKKNNKNIP